MTLDTGQSILLKKKKRQRNLMNMRDYNKVTYVQKGEAFVQGKINSGQRPHFQCQLRTHSSTVCICNPIMSAPQIFSTHDIRMPLLLALSLPMICFHASLSVCELLEGCSPPYILQKADGFRMSPLKFLNESMVKCQTKIPDNFSVKCMTEQGLS